GVGGGLAGLGQLRQGGLADLLELVLGGAAHLGVVVAELLDEPGDLLGVGRRVREGGGAGQGEEEDARATKESGHGGIPPRGTMGLWFVVRSPPPPNNRGG